MLSPALLVSGKPKNKIYYTNIRDNDKHSNNKEMIFSCFPPV